MESISKDAILTIRKKIGIYILMLIFKIVKPTEYSHEYSEEFKKLEELLKQL